MKRAESEAGNQKDGEYWVGRGLYGRYRDIFVLGRGTHAMQGSGRARQETKDGGSHPLLECMGHVSVSNVTIHSEVTCIATHSFL